MPFSGNFGRPVSAEAKEQGGEPRLVIKDDSGTRISLLFDSMAAASYAAAGIQGARALDRDRAGE